MGPVPHGSSDEQSELTAGDLLRGVLLELVADIQEKRPAALADDPDAVHQLRTSVRRARNLLAVFSRCFEATEAEALGRELAAYGGLLGECRDLEVRASDAMTALEALGLVEELAGVVVDPLRAAHDKAHARLVAWHRGPGPDRLDDRLTRWATAPPLDGRAGRRAGAVALKALRRQVRRVLDRADDLGGAHAEERRHELRKAARRLRHTADAVAAADVAGAARLGRLGHDIQGMLGDHRDALLLAAHVRACAEGAADRASYDLVVEHAEDLAEGALDGLDGAVAALRAHASS